MDFMIVFQIVVLICSAVIHEVSHGYVAQALGDKTAEEAGRLTLNPLKHLDLYGSFLLPLILYYVSQGTFVFGWAKPVPYNPYNLKDPKKGGALIAAAGPASNFLSLLCLQSLFVYSAEWLFSLPSFRYLPPSFLSIYCSVYSILCLFRLSTAQKYFSVFSHGARNGLSI